MIITELEIRCCRHTVTALTEDAMRSADHQQGLEFLVVTLKTDDGLEASSFGFAGRSARGSGELAAAAMRPFLIGKHALLREQIWQQFRTEDRWWNHLPIYSYGPFDVALWLLGAKAAGQPLYHYLGGCRDQVPVYASSLVLPSAEAYAAQARQVQAKGYHAYKVHPPGRSYAEDAAIHRAVREAVGPGFQLMSDPVACLNLEEAVRLGRELEKLDYFWIEEPFHDENFHTLRELTRVLDLAVVGTEVLAKHPYSVAECIATRVVDRVRADVSWTGGVTGVRKTATVAEAFDVNCEIHTSILHPLELVNLHCCAATSNCDFFELLLPEESFNFGLAQPIEIVDGMAKLPQGPGLGIEFDWNLIDNATLAVL